MGAALRTEIRADRVEEDEAAHRDVPECDEYGRRPAEPAKLPADTARQARMAELPDAGHDHSAEGADAGLPVVRELP